MQPKPADRPPRAWWAATLQGARQYAEDRYLACPPFFAVVDGHGGTAAANELIRIMRQRAGCIEALPPDDPSWWAVPPGAGAGRPPPGFDNACATLANMHSEASHMLARHASGAVSLCALAVPDAGATAVYFGCVGDVEGCVFDLGRRGRPGELSRAASLRVFDMARQPEWPLPAPAEAGAPGPARTAPHALRPPVLGWQPGCRHDIAGITYGIPTGFADAKSDSEWRLASRRIVGGGLLDRSRLGDAAWAPTAEADALMRVQVTAGCDDGHAGHARYLASVEPTRAYGDSATVVLSDAEIYALRLAPQRHPRVLLLCSDGVFDGDAYPDLPAVAAFLDDPPAWVAARFYHPAQALTAALLAAGCLPPALFAPARPGAAPPAGAAATTDLCNAWRLVATDGWSAVRGLLTRHLNCARRLPREHAQTRRWLAACRHSAHWLLRHAPTAPPSLATAPDLAVQAAAHLAVVMGSHDNVTVLAALLPAPLPAAPCPPPAASCPLPAAPGPAAPGPAPIYHAPDASPPRRC